MITSKIQLAGLNTIRKSIIFNNLTKTILSAYYFIKLIDVPIKLFITIIQLLFDNFHFG